MTLVGCLTLTLAQTAPAQAAPDDHLNIQFQGSLVGTEAYTTTEGEQMLGVVNRYDGGEEQFAGGVRLTEDSHGIMFTAADITLGDGTITQGFVSETTFTPTERPGTQATLLSAGGNLFVRNEHAGLTYGWSTNAGGNGWQNVVNTIPMPELNQEHTVSIAYIPGDENVMHFWLDGKAYPSVSSPDAPVIANDLEQSFGFGNEVHTQGRERAFIGSLAHIRTDPVDTEFSPELFELQPEPATADLLFVDGFAGTLESGAYTPADDETLTGSLQSTGASVSDEALTLDDRGSAVFTPEHAEGAVAAETPLVVEASVSDIRDGRLVTVGDFTADIEGQNVVFGAGDATATVELAATDTIVSFAIARSEDGTVTVYPAVDGTEHDPLVLGATPIADGAGTVTFGSAADAAAGAAAVQAIRVAELFTDEVNRHVFSLQPEAPEVCTPMVDISPGNQIEVSPEDCTDNILAKSTLVRPTEQQLAWQETQLTAFVHFGINTFYDQEWGHGDEDPGQFQPTEEVDAAAWVKELRDAGYRYAILTVKHHDGFLSYPSRYSDYSVASTPWLDGNGDILRDFTDAAREYGMGVGVYMSPADSNQEKYGVYGNGSEQQPRTIPTLVEGDDRAGQDLPTFTYEATDYGAYFLNTLYEILTEYGDIDEVWFDGAEGNTEKHEAYDYAAFYDMIHQLQPDAVVAVGGRDVRWVGNERGEARPAEWASVPIVDDEGAKISTTPSAWDQYGQREQLVNAVQGGDATHLKWWPSEADMKLTQGWFAHDSDVPKSPDALMQHYRETTGRNSVMLLNVPPTTTGLFAEASIEAINGFAEERRKQYTDDVALGQPATAGESTSALITDGDTRTGWASESAEPSTVTVEFDGVQPITSVWLAEDVMHNGQSIEHAVVEARVGGEWQQIGEVHAVGVSQAITTDAPVQADAVRVQVLQARGVYSLATLQAFTTLEADPGLLTEVHLDCAAPVAGDGSAERPFNSLEQFRQAELASGADVVLAAADCADSTTPFWGYGIEDAPITVSLAGDAAPTFGDRTAADVFGHLTAQGWVMDLPEDTTDPVDPTESDDPVDPTDPVNPSTPADDSADDLPETGGELPLGILLAAALLLGTGLALRHRWQARA